MVIRFELVQKQTQKLILSPQMQQAIKLLQLPLMQLQQIVQQEMLQNPVLEEAALQEEEQVIEQQQETEKEEAPSEKDELTFEEEFNRLAEIDDEWKDYFRQSGSYRKYSEEDEERRRFLEASIVKPETLQENLLNQLSLATLNDKQRNICEAIIGNIDNNGYLQSSVEDIAQQLGASPDEVEEMLSLVQMFSPVGIGARNLRECLLIQLRRLVNKDSLVFAIVDRHLDDLGKKRYRHISRALKVPPARLQKAAEIIATLEPKPGRMFSSESTQYVTPEIFVEKDEDNDEYIVILNDDRIPHLRISNLYRKLMKGESADKKTKNYIREKIKAGQWLMRNIQQRQQTIYKISSEIVEKQREFFDEGITHLKPLTMQKIADSLGIHESTVSRAISGKYIQTPHGLFDLKYFFTTGIESVSGASISVTNIKGMIQRMVSQEDPQRPLTDQKIIAKLYEKGIKLARRTVTKYRKVLKILPSNMRRKF